MEQISWPYFDPDFENLEERIYGPSCRVCIDNDCCKKCTVVMVDSVNKQGLLLEVVQVLTDADLYISKSYISSDAKWFMDVFHVRDQLGNKVTDKDLINYLKQAIGARKGIQYAGDSKSISDKVIRTKSSGDLTAIEMTGTNRPGLFSEISAVLADLRCNIVEAHAWSHNACLACVAYVSDESTCTRIDDPNRLATIEDHLSTVLCPATQSKDDQGGAKAGFPECDCSMIDAERRLHKLMLANRDFDEPLHSKTSPSSSLMAVKDNEEGRRTTVFIDRCNEKGYSVVNVQCVDRRRLMFDIVCTLTDMQYAVFHASITSHGAISQQEYYIRHTDGHMLDSAREQEQVRKCLEAAIERRICEGVRLEFCAQNRVGLLPYVTRVIREYGFTVARADIETQGERTMNIFYVQDISGNKVDMNTLELMRKEMGQLAFEVKNELPRKLSPKEVSSSSLSSMLRSQIERLSHNFISI